MGNDIARIKALRRLLADYSHQYYVLSASAVPDDEYDRLYAELLELEAANPDAFDPHSPTQRVGAPVTESGTVKHRVRMLSLDNVRSASEVLAFFGVGQEVVLEPKIDGLSLVLHYKKGHLKQALTRGDGDFGREVTAAARTIKTIPLSLPVAMDISVLGEVYLTYSNFNELNEKAADGEVFANPRNAASGAMALNDPAEVAARNLSFVAYGCQNEFANIKTQEQLVSTLEAISFQSVRTLPVFAHGGQVFDTISLVDEATLAALLADAGEKRKDLDLATDGLVLKINSLVQQRESGAGTTSPKWACAFKFPPERKATKLLGVTVQVGKSGKITPVAELLPVWLSGSVVRRATLCNQDEINRLGIAIGDDVFVQRAAEVIPQICGVSVKGGEVTTWQMPSVCPSCKSKLVRLDGMVDLYCLYLDCPDQMLERLKHAVSKAALDIDGCGEALIQALIAHGVKRLSDFFSLKDAGFLKAAARKNYLEGREKAKSAPLWRKLMALGIDRFGKSTCQAVAHRWADFMLAIGEPEELKARVGDATYTELVNWLDRNAEEIARLEAAGFVLRRNADESNGALQGKVFCITGGLSSGSREEVEEQIMAAGGAIKSSVSKKVHYLVAGMNAGETKTKAAARHGTLVIDERALYALMGVAMPVAVDFSEREY